MIRARIQWVDTPDPQVINASEASVEVNEYGVIKVVRGDRIRIIAPTAYKWLELET